MKTAMLLLALTFCSSLMSAVASPFDVTFKGNKKSAGASQNPNIITDASNAVAKEFVSSNKPFRQATNGSTPAGWIQIGTPRKWLFVIFDTGSDKLVAKTWETVASELATMDQGIQGMVLPSGLIYDHDNSSTYHRKFIKDSHGKDRPKQSSITYGSGTAITDEGTENVLIGNRSLSNFTLMEITADSLQLLHTSKGIAGVLGLQHMKNQSLGHSLFSRMRDASELTSFGYCRGTGNNGTFIWGDDSKEGQEISVIGQMHWAMKLEGVEVETKPSFLQKKQAQVKDSQHPFAGWPFGNDDGSDSQDAGDVVVDSGDADASGGDMDMPFDPAKILDGFKGLDDIFKKEHMKEMEQEVDHAELLKKICTDEKCTSILDTGSNIIAGPKEAMDSITKLVDVKTDCSNFDQLPDIKVKIDGMHLKIPPSGYVMKVPMPSWAGTYKEHGQDASNGEGAAEADFAKDMASSESEFEETAPGTTVEVIEVIQPGFVRRHQQEHLGALSEQKTLSHREVVTGKWKAVFDDLHRRYGIDMREQVSKILKQRNSTDDQFMCMPALVPLDKKTQYGPLWVVGTPLLDAYYARWSFAKGDESPKIHLKALQDTEVCKSDEHHTVTPGLLRKDGSANPPSHKAKALTASRGPVERLPEEIRYPHWAKDLLHI